LEDLDSKLIAAGTSYNILITCDTVLVSSTGKILEKPASESELRTFMESYSGASIRAISTLQVKTKATESGPTSLHSENCETTINFAVLSPKTIDTYCSTYFDIVKYFFIQLIQRNAAGGFRIQEEGGSLIKDIQGSYDNVVGLPLNMLCSILIKYCESIN